jgi:hypothetical protein
MSKIEVNQISSQCGSTLTIGQSGDTVTLACGATQTGFGRTGTVDWCTTAKTAPFTGASGKGYFVNTTCGAVTVTLPATPTAGDIISIKDYARTAGTNNINFCRNGSKMDGVCANGSINTNGDSTTLIYVDGTKGWTSILDSTTNNYGTSYVTATGGTVLTCGDYKTHIFTADGSFAVSCAGNPAGSDTVDYLAVAGGAGGGTNYGGGGGGGGYRTNYPSGCTGIPVTTTSYPITVGAGGVGAPNPSSPEIGTSGSNSIFSSITSAGGGGGGGSTFPGVSGGSGGGGGNSPSGSYSGTGSGNTPPVSPPQGNPSATSTPQGTGGGGGGGGGAGGPNTAGGIGATTAIFACAPQAPSYGTPGPAPGRYFSGGGGGYSAGVGGAGGGGTAPAGSAPVNTGGGGAACGAGGSGIVIIRYKFQN